MKCDVAETVIFADKMNRHTNKCMHKSKYSVRKKEVVQF